MDQVLDALLARLTVERESELRFIGTSPKGQQRRVYGGQVLAQSMSAAIRTVDPERCVHSLHAYFMRPGNPAEPIVYEVDPLRDGKGFSTRAVVARQSGRAIFNASLSFQVPENGLEHQDPMPEVPPPESVQSDFDYHTALHEKDPARYEKPGRWAMDYRVVHRADPVAHAPMPAHCGLWMRAKGSVPAMPDVPGIHETLLAYMSDNYLIATSLMPHGMGYDHERLQNASLDHGLWFYSDFRADEWLYYDITSPRAAGGRGFNVGRIFTQDGRLVATAVQEGLIRLLPAAAP